MVIHTFKTSQHLLKDFESVYDTLTKAIARYLILEAFDVLRHLEINVKIKHALIINDKKLPKTILGNTS